MKYLKTFEAYEDLISQVEFYKVPTGAKTVFKPSFGAKRGETDFYQLRLDGKPVVELEINPNSIYDKPEIMSVYSDLRGKGLGEYLAKKVLDIYLQDEVFVRCTKDSKGFWEKCGATVVDSSDPYLLHFTKHLKSYNESFISEAIPMAASMLSILALVAIPFIPMALNDAKEAKEAKLRDMALKNTMLRSILEKIGRNYQAKILLESYKLGEINIEEFSTEMRRILKLLLTRTQYEYCDDVIEKLK